MEIQLQIQKTLRMDPSLDHGMLLDCICQTLDKIFEEMQRPEQGQFQYYMKNN